ncbi:ABC transporter ATP-binding protein [Aureimonas populi]|uniref:ABC transporter ATP-binding protein n=1 Tax=Aureimonas populi TaxID=1701758 RepID=A0ABW5CQB9_9HYPH|nr:ATP-binding cassette domain-containing protein [Aureimonas populi]
MSRFILETADLSMEFRPPRKLLQPARPPVRAVEGVDLRVGQGEVLGIVGESGSGKSTLAKTILGLYRPSRGAILLDGKESRWNSRRQARRERRAIQYVHQDPGAALDPWWSIGRTLHEALIIHGEKDAAQRNRLIDTMLEAVGLSPEFRKRYPHELSGGQQRRIGIARTLILKPRIVILDEPTSGLDMSVQKTVLTLVHGIRREFDLTYLFVSHDLSVVRHLCDRTAIMKEGRIVEIGDTASIFADPRHDYTRTLIAAAPSLHSERLAARPSEKTEEHP